MKFVCLDFSFYAEIYKGKASILQIGRAHV